MRQTHQLAILFHSLHHDHMFIRAAEFMRLGTRRRLAFFDVSEQVEGSKPESVIAPGFHIVVSRDKKTQP